MTHLTMDQLVLLREPGAEPGLQSARDHLAGCDACRAELDRLHQRVARLRALPALRPPRDLWPAVDTRLVADRRRRRSRWLGAGGVALAASIALLLVLRDLTHPAPAGADTAIAEAMNRSQQLEQTLNSYRPEQRITDGLTARVAGQLEDRIAVIDHQLELAQLEDGAGQETALLKLWRERVGLLDALVDVHLTRASNVGL